MNRITAILMLFCGIVIIITQLIDMLNDRPILLIVGCSFSLVGILKLIFEPKSRAE